MGGQIQGAGIPQQMRKSLGNGFAVLAADADIDLAFFGDLFAHGCTLTLVLVLQTIGCV